MPIYGKAKKQKPDKGKKPGGGATARPGGPNRGGYAPGGAPRATPPMPDGGYYQGPPRAIEPPGWDGGSWGPAAPPPLDYRDRPDLPSLMPKLDTGGWGDPPLDPGSGPGDMPGMKPGPGGGSTIGRGGMVPYPADIGGFGDTLKGSFGSGGAPDPLGMTRLMDRVRGGLPDMGGGAVGAPMDPLMMALLKLQGQR